MTQILESAELERDSIHSMGWIEVRIDCSGPVASTHAVLVLVKRAGFPSPVPSRRQASRQPKALFSRSLRDRCTLRSRRTTAVLFDLRRTRANSLIKSGISTIQPHVVPHLVAAPDGRPTHHGTVSELIHEVRLHSQANMDQRLLRRPHHDETAKVTRRGTCVWSVFPATNLLRGSFLAPRSFPAGMPSPLCPDQ